MSQIQAGERPGAPRIRLRHILFLGGLTAFGPLSTDMYLPALPAVSADLRTTMALTQLTLTICIFGLALGQVLVGPISDRYGRRRPLLIGIGLFTLASLACTLAPSIGVLAALRLVQGVAGSAGVVIALAIARDRYAGVTLARAIGMLMTVNFLAPIAAPVLGGQILRVTAWRGIFEAIALIAGLFLAATARWYRETLPATQRAHGGAAATRRAFGQLLTSRQFLGYALACSFAFGAGIVYISASPFVLQQIYGLSPQVFGLVFGGNAVGLALCSQLSARLVRRVSPAALLTGGAVLLAASGTLLLVAVLSSAGVAPVLAAFWGLTASLGLIAPNATALALADIDVRMAGSAAALLGMLQLVLGAAVAPVIGLGGTASALPMALGIAAFAGAALTTVVIVCLPVARRAEPAR